MIKVFYKNKVGETTSIIPHSNGIYPVWFEGEDDVQFIESALVHFEKVCAISTCKSVVGVKFIRLTDCFLCKKCNNELGKSMEIAMRRNRYNDIEL